MSTLQSALPPSSASRSPSSWSAIRRLFTGASSRILRRFEVARSASIGATLAKGRWGKPSIEPASSVTIRVVAVGIGGLVAKEFGRRSIPMARELLCNEFHNYRQGPELAAGNSSSNYS